MKKYDKVMVSTLSDDDLMSLLQEA